MVLLLALCFTHEARLEAQGGSGDGSLMGSTYLPLDHWAYDYVNVLVARGVLQDLSPLVQPYRRLDVARAVADAERRPDIGDAERAWLAALAGELTYEMRLLRPDHVQALRFDRKITGGVEAMSHTHRDPLRPEGDAALFPVMELTLAADAPALAGGFRMRWDNQYLNDPQFPNGDVTEPRACDPFVEDCAYRVEDAYVEVQLPYASLFFGRVYRNWGLPGGQGLLVSDYAYSYDHAAYRFGSQRIALTGLFTALADWPGDTARYFSSHRFDWRIRENFALALSESVVYGGANRRLDFNFTNPVGVWEVSAASGGRERNDLGMAEVWWRPLRRLVVYGALMVDNTTVGDPGKANGLVQWAAQGGIQLPSLTPTLAVRLDLAAVSSLAYRTNKAPWEIYAVEGIGLGPDKADALIVTLAGNWLASRSLVLKPTVHAMWRGEDDLRDPFPPDGFTGHGLFLIGTVQTLVRPGVTGRLRFSRGEVEWDAALNLLKNRGNLPGGWSAVPAGRLRVVLHQPF